MRISGYEHDGIRRVGRIDGESITPLGDFTAVGPETSIDALHGAAPGGDPLPLAEVTLVPPVPAKVFCVGLNYLAHVEETRRDIPEYPVLFPKFAASLVGPQDDIVLPPESSQVDFEVELAVVMGRAVRRVSEEEAQGAVLGYAVANDISMRDFQHKTHQWMQGKAWDRSTPVGTIVTADEVDPSALDIRLEVNGVEMQSANTSQLMFPIPRLISLISEFTELLPGDIILTGTPSGIGVKRKPPVLLADGDVVTAEVSGVGRIRNRARDEHVR
jgi:acylpyruvate hydrolase